jgi:hypothetical protein
MMFISSYDLVVNALDSLHTKEPSSYVAFTQNTYSAAGFKPVTVWLKPLP